MALLLALLAAPAAEGKLRSKRVAADYFGVAYPRMRMDSSEVRERQLAAIAAAGIGQVRVAISWRDLEPEPANGNPGNYVWTLSDLQVRQLAEHGLTMMPAFTLAPAWAASGGSLTDPLACDLTDQVSAGTTRIGEYAAAAGALAARYGPGGSFWRENPQLVARPIRTWEIWNEPNLNSYWCPRPDPGTYAELFVAAANRIKAASPGARVITGGLALGTPSGRNDSVADFLSKALARRPDLWAVADGVGAHVFPGGALRRQLVIIRDWRTELNAAGVPKGEPIFATEVGWGLPGPFELTEKTRAQRYRFFSQRIVGSTCNVAMMIAHAWTTSAPGQPIHDDNAGIADRDTAALSASAIAYRNTIALMRGKRKREAPHARVPTCKTMPKLDRDRDKVAEHRDYYPLNPKRWKGPKRWYKRARR